MIKRIAAMMGLSLMFFALNASAQKMPKGATYVGTLKQANGGVDWACTATATEIVSDNSAGTLTATFKVRWYDQKLVTYSGAFGAAGGGAGDPDTMNATGTDGSQVRFHWNSTYDQLQVEWWPDMKAKAGQKQNKPALVKGTLKLLTIPANAQTPTGYFMLQSQGVESKGLFLESNAGPANKSVMGGSAFMSDQKGTPTGQKWKMIPVQ